MVETIIAAGHLGNATHEDHPFGCTELSGQEIGIGVQSFEDLVLRFD